MVEPGETFWVRKGMIVLALKSGITFMRTRPDPLPRFSTATSLVTGQTELTLHKQGGHTTLVGGHQIRRPKPMRQGNLSPVKNSPRSQRDFGAGSQHTASVAGLPIRRLADDRIEGR